MYFVFNVRIIKGRDSNLKNQQSYSVYILDENKDKIFVVCNPPSLSIVIIKKSVLLNILFSIQRNFNFTFLRMTSEPLYNLGFLIDYVGTK